ncbi:MAG: hypothetical protein HY360_07285 [Verrucomicrobia bacterium]|nr:hypothetical protein [Verrucomicrobiota bacterium]
MIGAWPGGAPAAFRHHYGKGIVYALGVNLALAYRDGRDDPSSRAWAALLGEAGVKRPAWMPERVLVYDRRNADREIWFVFNPAEQSKNIRLPRQPECVWESNGARFRGRTLQLPAGAAWVAEMPIVPFP